MGLEERLRRVRIGLIRRIGRFGIRRRYFSRYMWMCFFVSGGCSEINFIFLWRHHSIIIIITLQQHLDET